MVVSNDTSSKFPEQGQGKIIKEVELPPTLQAVISQSDNILKLIQPDKEQRKAVERLPEDKVPVERGTLFEAYSILFWKSDVMQLQL